MPCEIQFAAGYHAAAGARARHGQAIADDPQEPGTYHAVLAIDGRAHETQQGDPGGLYIGAQYFVWIAAGEKYVGADDLRGIVGADTQNLRRLQPQCEGRDDQQQEECAGDAANDLAECRWRCDSYCHGSYQRSSASMAANQCISAC